MAAKYQSHCQLNIFLGETMQPVIGVMVFDDAGLAQPARCHGRNGGAAR
jgi:hypothetical protein